MNILVIAHFQDDNSPYVSFVHSQVLALKKLGHNVIVIAPVVLFKKYQCEEVQPFKKVDGISVYYPKYISLSNRGKYFFNIMSGYYSINKTMKKFLKKQKIDIIHAHTIPFDGAVAVKLKKKYGIPVIITTHGSDTFVEINNKKELFLEKICKSANGVVTVSKKLSNILRTVGINSDVVYNGFCQKNMDNINKKKHRIIQVSSLINQKKVDITINAFSEIKKEYPDAELIVIGSGIEKENLHELANSLDIKVKFIDFLSNDKVLEEMAKSEIFLMPSINEGFGIVYLEAMSKGCIAIGTVGEGIDGVIVNDENGILVPPCDSLAIIKSIKKCWESQEYSKKLRKNAIETACAFTWDSNAEQYTAIYEKANSLRRNNK